MIRFREHLLLAFTLALSAVFATRLVAPTYLPLGARDWMVLAAVGKIFLLGLGAVASWSASALFPPETGVRRAWRSLGFGLASFGVGQSILAVYQIGSGVSAPFPSPAEIFYLAAYPFLIASLFGFVSACREGGWPLGEPAEDRRRMFWTAFIAFLAVAPALVPIARSQDSLLAKAINLTYPLLDLALLAPAWLVLRVALRLLGGQVQRVWLALFSGAFALILGDLAFSYLASFAAPALDPAVDVLYILSYGAFALAPLAQRSIASS